MAYLLPDGQLGEERTTPVRNDGEDYETARFDSEDRLKAWFRSTT